MNRVREYVGARYVPKYDGEWDVTKTYEPLTIVTVENVGSYTSKKNVPVGIDITNTEYWALSGYTTGQIIDLQERMTTAEDDIDNLEYALDELEGKLEDEINFVKDIANTANRKMLLIADSYGDNPRADVYWTTVIKSVYTSARDKAHGGYGFMTYSTPSPNYCFLGLLKEFKEELTSDERAEITDIVVCGGWNDAWQVTRNGKSASDVLQPIKNFVDYANEWFSNAIPHIGFIGWQSNDVTQADPTTQDDLNLIQDMYEKTRYKNLHVLAGVSTIMKNCRYLDNSYSHPNNSGGTALGMAIMASMFGGFRYSYRHSISASDISWNTGNTGSISGQVCADDNTVTIDLYLSNISADTNSDSCLFTFNADALPWGHNTTYKCFAYNFTKKHALYCSIGADRKFRVYNTAGETTMTNEVMIVSISLNSRYN